MEPDPFWDPTSPSKQDLHDSPHQDPQRLVLASLLDPWIHARWLWEIKGPSPRIDALGPSSLDSSPGLGMKHSSNRDDVMWPYYRLARCRDGNLMVRKEQGGPLKKSWILVEMVPGTDRL